MFRLINSTLLASITRRSGILLSCLLLVWSALAFPLGSAYAAAETSLPAVRVAKLEARLRLLEDHQEILDILAASPFSSDVDSVSLQDKMYSEDAIMDRTEGQEPLRGRKAVVDTIRDPDHLAQVESGMAHFAGLPQIRVNGDRAVATGYLEILVPNPEGPKVALSGHPASSGLMVWQVTTNRWELSRTERGWRITKRIIRPAPGKSTRELLHRGIDTTD